MNHPWWKYRKDTPEEEYRAYRILYPFLFFLCIFMAIVHDRWWYVSALVCLVQAIRAIAKGNPAKKSV
ncbi:MAG: hypothetical protein HC898_12020 [Phycisphaerales bacterium]|nr:hypothetical protein [Phycisphaerales bacterium]